MKRPILATILALILATLACGEYTTPVPTETDAPTPLVVETSAPPTVQPAKLPTLQAAPTVPVWTAVVKLPVVNVRETPGGAVIGSLSVGDTVTIDRCEGDWCKVTAPISGYVFRGCLSDNPGKKGCEAK